MVWFDKILFRLTTKVFQIIIRNKGCSCCIIRVSGQKDHITTMGRICSIEINHRSEDQEKDEVENKWSQNQLALGIV